MLKHKTKIYFVTQMKTHKLPITKIVSSDKIPQSSLREKKERVVKVIMQFKPRFEIAELIFQLAIIDDTRWSRDSWIFQIWGRIVVA